jgi:hypothetical protein
MNRLYLNYLQFQKYQNCHWLHCFLRFLRYLQFQKYQNYL